MAEAVAACGIPVVDVLGVVSDSPFPAVRVDNNAIAYMAAEHFLERGLRWAASSSPCATPVGERSCRPSSSAPTVHADDSDAILENAAAVSDMIDTVRRLTGKTASACDIERDAAPP